MPAALLPLDTERLTLRHFRSSDVVAFHAYRNDPEVARWQSWEGITLEAAEQFAREFSAGGPAPPGEWFQIAVARRPTGSLVGDCALKLRADLPGVAEIGFTIAREHQGQGYAFEAVSRLVGHLFGELGLHRIVAETDAENTRSRRLLERLGMRREATTKAWFKGRLAEECRYSLGYQAWRDPHNLKSCLE